MIEYVNISLYGEYTSMPIVIILKEIDYEIRRLGLLNKKKTPILSNDGI